jgi:hypothetical protein
MGTTRHTEAVGRENFPESPLPRFTWGDEVRVLDEPRRDPERIGAVRAFTDEPGIGWVYLVEFGDGSEAEFPEARLDSA